MKTIIVVTPYYNPYFATSDCSGYEDFYLCREHTNVDLNEEEFKKKLNEYKKSLKSDKIKEEEKPNIEEPEKNTLLDYIWKYKYHVIGVIITAILYIIISLIKKKQSKRGIL